MSVVLVFSIMVAIGTCTPVTENAIYGNPMISVIRPGDIRDYSDVDATKIKYFYFQKGSAGSTEISSTDVGKLLGTTFNASLESIFIIHGWINSNSSSVNTVIREALQKNHHVNIFVVDWSKYSRLGYFTALTKIKGVGVSIADFIKQIVYKLNVKLNRVRLVGFSLGSHIAGFAGKSLDGKLASIVEYGVSGTPAIPVIRPEDIKDLRADPTKIKYFVYRGSSKGTQIRSTDVGKLSKTAFNASLESVFVIHGWTNSNTSGISTSIRNALLKNHNVNIFVVDWSWYSRLDYVTAVSQVRSIGQCVGDFIKQTVNKLNVKLNKVRLVGFSLGSHVAGIAGKSLNGKLASIFGIDPAGPGFFHAIPNGRLDSGDAQYVQAIHTNAGILGCTYSVGHSDFWPNGGSFQPGCLGVDVGGICSHNRVYALYAESLGKNRFLATKCNSYLGYETGACRRGETSLMGGLQPNKEARGDYYLDTNSRSPYGKN